MTDLGQKNNMDPDAEKMKNRIMNLVLKLAKVINAEVTSPSVKYAALTRLAFELECKYGSNAEMRACREVFEQQRNARTAHETQGVKQ